MTQPPQSQQSPQTTGHASEPGDPHGFGPVIHRYTREQALADGVLVDLTPWARELGFVVPVACTRSVWDRWITPPEPVAHGHGQSARGRGHDLLWMLLLAIRRSREGEPADRVGFEVLFLQRPGDTQRVELVASCGPGDRGEPVVTVMRPGED